MEWHSTDTPECNKNPGSFRYDTSSWLNSVEHELTSDPRNTDNNNNNLYSAN